MKNYENMHFLTLFYVSVLTSVSADYAIVISVSANMKSDISVVIGIGRYEKMLIGRPLIHALY